MDNEIIDSTEQLQDNVDQKGEQSNGDMNNIDLKHYLSQYSVPDSVYSLLNDESITISELFTFTNDDLKDWCVEHKLKTIERRRFINAVQNLPNSQLSENGRKQEIVKVYLVNEEKEQMNELNVMKRNINNVIKHINNMSKSSTNNINDIKNEITNVFYQIETLVEQSKQTQLKEVKYNVL